MLHRTFGKTGIDISAVGFGAWNIGNQWGEIDEATADAGSAGASLLESAAEAALADRSALIVAHRLGQARRADRILLMDNGLIVEQGSHEDLVSLGGRYAQLWTAWSANL